MISHSTATRARSAAGRPVTTVVDGCVEVGRHVVFAFRAIAGIPTALHRYFSHVLRHIGEVSFGYASLLAGGGTIGIVLAMSAVAAMMVGVETQRGLELIGMTSLSGMLSAIANTRELAPVVASIALAAKVGTGFTAQLGAMRISDEIDALDAMAVRSVPFLASTRLIAAAVCVIPIYMVGLLGSYVATRLVVVNFQGNSAGTYDYYFHLALSPSDLWYSLTKPWCSRSLSRSSTARTGSMRPAVPRVSAAPPGVHCARASSRSGSPMWSSRSRCGVWFRRSRGSGCRDDHCHRRTSENREQGRDATQEPDRGAEQGRPRRHRCGRIRRPARDRRTARGFGRGFALA